MKSCLVGIAKNEEMFVQEWIVYHLMMGFDTVILFDNNSTDRTAERARLARRTGDVRVIDWPVHPGQIQAYDAALERFGAEFDVFCMLDIDEFLVPMRDDNLVPVLARALDHSFIAVNWMMYGSSGHVARPEGLVIENYVQRARKGNFHIKTIVGKSGFGSRFYNPHFMVPSSYVDLDGYPVAWQPQKAGGKTVALGGMETARINHYYCKSREDYGAKLLRGKADSKSERQDVFKASDVNDVHDPVITSRFPQTVGMIRDEIKKLQQRP